MSRTASEQEHDPTTAQRRGTSVRPRRRQGRAWLGMGLTLALAAPTVATAEVPTAGAPAAPAATQLYGLPALPRLDFNRLAAQQGLPLFWEQDTTNPGVFDPAELAVLGVDGARARLVSGAGFAKPFESYYRQLVEVRRREAVRTELDQGMPTLVLNDLSALPAAEKELVRRIARAAALIDALFGRQKGAAALAPRLAKADPESRALFQRANGPWCVAARTENDPFCSALPDFPPRRWEAYPAEEVHDSALCEKLTAQPNAKELLAPFTVVRKQGAGYVALPLTAVYGREMQAIAAELRAAAKAIHGGQEAPLEAYLLAAARSFETNEWETADAAWAAMNATNSKWYLRIAPDEVYWDLCQEKAGFHVTFARIDSRSLEWQAKLTPLRDELEGSLAELIGPPYKARPVKFQMPDFIGIVINAGDSRSAMGATIGQSLPNWGRVAEAGGRTVVMTNLYVDPDSESIQRQKAEALLTPATMEHYTSDPLPGLVDIILHESTHNLGPYSDYKLDGRGPGEIFGGRQASTLEELKAQTGSLYYTELLRQKGVISDEFARQLYTHAVVWCFGHISQGMFAPTGNPKPYSQLAAVHLGWLMQEGALSWETAPDPATGRPVGRFALHYDKIVPAVTKLMQRVGRIKATGDVADAKALLDAFVSGDKKSLVHVEEITDRVLRFPKGSMVYSIKL